ncbi:MAG: AIR synthase-related protein [Candidatus Aenigmatarchaeota archaeon]
MPKEAYNPEKPFSEQIRKIIESTHPKDGIIVVTPHGKRYRIDKDAAYWSQYSEMRATDGIGTKAKLHWENDSLPAAAQDALAMVIDDFAEFGYQLYDVQAHILMQEEKEPTIFQLVQSMSDLCKEYVWDAEPGIKRPIIYSGGETAIINTIQGFEMGICGIGKVRKGEALSPSAKEGDEILGLGSSGPHSNGYTFFRKELFEKRQLTLDSRPYGRRLGDELTVPTRIYAPALRELVEAYPKDVHGMVHITGGGLTKAKELIPEEKNVNIEISPADSSLEPQELFWYVHDELLMKSYDMVRKFNNGIGYMVAVSPDVVGDSLKILKRYCPADIIGFVTPGVGKAIIESPYDDPAVKFEFQK